jgi:LmbE family N-acetylglucosaminyl deacetylase
VNLRWPDGGITGTPEQIEDVIRLVREHQPRTVALPYWDDRHPDHRAASEVLSRAVFRSALRRCQVRGTPSLDAWRPDWTCFYFINDSAPVSFVVDVSAQYERKRQALACHRSQFRPADPGSVDTRLTSPRFQQLIESRDAQFGALTGVAFAEGLIVREPIVRRHLLREPDAAPAPRPA